MTFKKLTMSLFGAACVALGTGQSAQALTFSEPPDAGQLLTNAADTTANSVGNDGATNLTQITGRLAGATDLFKIKLDQDSVFSALAQGIPNNPVLDPQLFLFDSVGRGLFANDDGGAGLTAKIEATLTAGIYYLGISKYDRDPLDANGNEIFPDGPFTAQVQPFDPNAILNRWRGVPSEGSSLANYEILLTATPVPTPALLPGLMGMGLGVWRRRKSALG
jgi:hypothetical protein